MLFGGHDATLISKGKMALAVEWSVGGDPHVQISESDKTGTLKKCKDKVTMAAG